MASAVLVVPGFMVFQWAMPEHALAVCRVPPSLSAAQKMHQELATAQPGKAAHEQSVAH